MNVDKVDGDKAFELEHRSMTIEEVPTPISTASLDSAACQKLLDLPAPKASLLRAGIKSACMQQVLLLGKMDVCRLMKKQENKHDCCTHRCKRCGMLINLSWKVKGSYENKG